MGAFQSLADNTIMIVLAIAYIWTYKAQRNTITAQKDTIDAMRVQIDTSKTLTDQLSADLNTYKKMVRLEEINQYMDMRVELRLMEALEGVTRRFIEDNNLLNKAIEIVSKDHAKVMSNQFMFMMYVIWKNRLNDAQIKRTIELFFSDTPWLYQVIIEKLPDFPGISKLDNE